MSKRKNEPAHADFTLSWSYTSGFFDSHGCVFKRTDGAYQLIFSKTNKQIISMIRDFISPSSNILSDDIVPIGRKRIYRLIISSYHDIIKIAKNMLPHSIVKRFQLSDALWDMKRRGYRYKSRVEKREWTEEEKIILRLTLDEPRAEVARRLNRPIGSIDQARHRLKREREMRER